MPVFLTVAWWAAKWAIARGAATVAKKTIGATVTPWLTPWVVVPVALVAGVVFAVVQVNSAYKRGYENGDTAGYARKAAEVADATADANGRIGAANSTSAAELAINDAGRAALVADVRQMSGRLAVSEQAAYAQQAVIGELTAKTRRLAASKTKIRVVEKPVIKIKRVAVPASCAVGETIAHKLNAIQ